jgi:hypothetical protein
VVANPGATAMTFNEFHNNLRILCWNIERYEVPWMDAAEWGAFTKDPVIFFIRANDTDAHRIWAIIKARQPKQPITETEE